MRVEYKGADGECKFRTAIISYNDSEEDRIAEITDKMYERGWQIGLCDGVGICKVEDKNDYRNFMDDWKERKRGR